VLLHKEGQFVFDWMMMQVISLGFQDDVALLDWTPYVGPSMLGIPHVYYHNSIGSENHIFRVVYLPRECDLERDVAFNTNLKLR